MKSPPRDNLCQRRGKSQFGSWGGGGKLAQSQPCKQSPTPGWLPPSLSPPPFPPHPSRRNSRTRLLRKGGRQKAWDGLQDGRVGTSRLRKARERASAGSGGAARRARASCPARPAGAGASQGAGEGGARADWPPPVGRHQAVGREPRAEEVGPRGLGRRLGPGVRPLACFPSSPGAMWRACEPSSPAAAKWVTKSAWWDGKVTLERTKRFPGRLQSPPPP